MLVAGFTMLAMKTGIEEFEVPEPEIDAFLHAAKNVARHYSVETTQKTLDWIAFAGISAQVFGTRAVAISIKAKAKGKTGQVVPFPMHTGGAGPAGPLPHDFTSG